MKSDAFRKKHIIQILEELHGSLLPLDTTLRKYFFLHKSIGSKDRKVISETIYGIVRWQGLIDEIASKPITCESRLAAYSSLDSLDVTTLNAQDHVKVSFPKILFNTLRNTFSLEDTKAFCLASNQKAPTYLRANLLKTTRSALLEKLLVHVKAKPCAHSPTGIELEEKINLFGLEEFKAGLFEMQDEASQLVADLVNVRGKELVLDYCAGSGGKALAIGAKMQNKGQLYLHDIRTSALEEAKKRLKRAGVQNAQILLADSPNKQKLQGKFDWVLIDAPCSGTGTYRRNPDMKWRFHTETIDELTALQRKVFQEALPFCKKGGHIVYATCSVLIEENAQQVEYFLKNYPLARALDDFHTVPSHGAMDGFFAAVFVLK